MTFTTEIAKRSSYRDALVRIDARRNLTTKLLSFVGGNGDNWAWVAPPDSTILSVTRNGVALTKANMDSTQIASSPLANDEYAVFENNDEFQIWVNLASAPSNTTNVIIITYSLHYATDDIRHYADPEDSDTRLVKWQPRLMDDPEVGTFFDDILAGVLSFNDTTIEIADADDSFGQYLTILDSMRSAKVTVWGIVNGNDNIRKLYTGEVTEIVRDDKNISLTVTDITNRLRQPAYMGDEAGECIFERTSDSFPYCDPALSGTPCRMMLAKFSRWGSKNHPLTYNNLLLDTEKMVQGVCIDWTSNVGGTTNRDWGLCRVLSDGLRAPSNFPAINSNTHLANVSMFRVTKTNFDLMDIEIGDSYKMQLGGTTEYGVVTRMVQIGSNVEVYFETNATTTPGFTNSTTVTGQKVTCVLTKADGSRMHAFEEQDFTLNETALTSGNKFINITFDNNFESSYTYSTGYFNDPTKLDPGSDNLFFRVRPTTTNMKHGSVLKTICEAAGMDTNAASFTTANTALSVNTYFSIPTTQEIDYNDYLKYAQDICKSTMGFLAANKDGQMLYKLIDTPVGGDSLGENNSKLTGYSVNFNEVVTGLIGVNFDLSFDGGVFVESAEATYLHDIKNVLRFYHVLEDISARLSEILDVLRHRKAIYTHILPHIELERELGDEATLSSTLLLGAEVEADVIITGIRKTMDETYIETTDLGTGG